MNYLEKAYATDPDTTFGKLSNTLALIIKAKSDQNNADKYLQTAVGLTKELKEDIVAKNIDATWLMIAWLSGISVFQGYRSPSFLNYANLPEARDALLHVVDENQGNINVRRFLGTIYSMLDEYEKAIQIFSNILEVQKTACTYTGRAMAHHRQDDLEKAIEDYTCAIKIDPEYSNAYVNRGLAYESKGNLEAAIQDYERAIKINPQDTAADSQRKRACATKTELERRIKWFTQDIRKNPKSALAYADRGNIYLQLGYLDKAIQDYTDAVTVDPKYEPAYVNRGLAYEKKGDLEKAMRDYTQAIRIDPRDQVAHNNRGSIYEKKGDLEKAIQNYNKALQIKSDYWVSLKNLGDVYVQKECFEEALAYYMRAYNPAPKDQKESIARKIKQIQNKLRNK